MDISRLEESVSTAVESVLGLVRLHEPLIRFQIEYEAQTGIHGGLESGGKGADMFRQHVAIKGEHLRDIDDRVLRQARSTCWDNNVTGRVAQFHVARDRHNYDSTDFAAVVCVGLDN